MPYHPFEPLYTHNSKVLILGTFPSVKSRQEAFYYAHPQNRFWKVIAALTNETLPQTLEAKKALLTKHRIALWDVIHSCDIIGSSDASITHVIPNDIPALLSKSSIEHIFANGAKAYTLYQTYCEPKTQRCIHKLPSTSPANAAYSFEALMEAWKIILA